MQEFLQLFAEAKALMTDTEVKPWLDLACYAMAVVYVAARAGRRTWQAARWLCGDGASDVGAAVLRWLRGQGVTTDTLFEPDGKGGAVRKAADRVVTPRCTVSRTLDGKTVRVTLANREDVTDRLTARDRVLIGRAAEKVLKDRLAAAAQERRGDALAMLS